MACVGLIISPSHLLESGVVETGGFLGSGGLECVCVGGGDL